MLRLKLIDVSKEGLRYSIPYYCPSVCRSRGRIVGGTKPILLRSIIITNFRHCHITGQLLNTTFIFDRCHRSSGEVTPVKYEIDPGI